MTLPRDSYDRQKYRRHRVVPLVVIVLTLSITALLYFLAGGYVDSRDQQMIESEIGKIETSINNRLNTYSDLIRNSAAAMTYSGIPRPEQFEAIAQRIDVEKQYPGITGFGFGAYVTSRDQAAFVRESRKLYSPDFRIYPESSEKKVVVTMRHPLTKAAQQAIGYDMWSSPERRAAMSTAQATGQVTMTARTLPPPRPDVVVEPTFILYAPVYSLGQPRDRDRKPVLGFTYAGFRGKKLFDEWFRAAAGQNMYVTICDGVRIDPKQQLYSNVPPGYLEPAVAQRTIEVLGNNWTIAYVPKPDLVHTAGEALIRWIPWAGLFVGLILGGLSYAQVRANTQLMRQTRALAKREAHQSLLSRIGAALAGSHNLDLTFSAVAEMVVPNFADRCMMDCFETGRVRRHLVVVPGEVVRGNGPVEGDLCLVDLPERIRDGHTDRVSPISEPLLSWANFMPGDGPVDLPPLTELVVAPIVVRGRVVAAMSFGAHEGRTFQAEDVRLAGQIAARAAVAYEASKLFDSLEHEIGERRAAESQVREVNENLERLVAERTRELVAANNELEAFCYSVSHDLRGPLRSVDGFSRALKEDYGDRLDPEGHDFIDRVRRAAKRMDELISALLSLSRLTRADVNIEPVSLSETAEEIGRDLVRTVPHIELVVQPNLQVVADVSMLRIIFDNLISNAIKFSQEGPSPKIEVGKLGDAFYVRDNGVGFSMQYANKLFLPFERLHPTTSYPGTGIGLATVQRVVARHGGRVWAEGEEGKGATFYFTLPTNQDSAN